MKDEAWRNRAGGRLCSHLASLIVIAAALGVAWTGAPAQAAERQFPSYARAPAWKQLNLAIGLPLRHRDELMDLLRQLQDPASPNYHRYLTSGQFAERF